MNTYWLALAAIAWWFMPNVTAGVLIGIASDFWLGLLLSSFLYPITWCWRVWMFSSEWVALRAANLNPNRVRLRNWPPMLVIYWIEFLTALTAALPIACIVYLVRTAM